MHDLRDQHADGALRLPRRDLGPLLRRLRLDQGLTLDQVAARCHVSRKAICSRELNGVALPAAAAVEHFDALGYDLALIPRRAAPVDDTHCDGCGGPCRDESASVDDDAPRGPLRSTETAQEPSVGGDGRLDAHSGSEARCDCGHDGLDAMWHLRPCPIAEHRARLRSLHRQPHSWTPRCGETCNHDTDDYPPLQETYPGSGIYE